MTLIILSTSSFQVNETNFVPAVISTPLSRIFLSKLSITGKVSSAFYCGKLSLAKGTENFISTSLLNLFISIPRNSPD